MKTPFMTTETLSLMGDHGRTGGGEGAVGQYLLQSRANNCYTLILVEEKCYQYW